MDFNFVISFCINKYQNYINVYSAYYNNFIMYCINSCMRSNLKIYGMKANWNYIVDIVVGP